MTSRKSKPGRRRQNRRNVLVFLGAVVFFFGVGFFLPIVVIWAAMSIPAALDPNAAPVDTPQVPLGFSVGLGAVMGIAAGVGLLLKWADRVSDERLKR